MSGKRLSDQCAEVGVSVYLADRISVFHFALRKHQSRAPAIRLKNITRNQYPGQTVSVQGKDADQVGSIWTKNTFFDLQKSNAFLYKYAYILYAFLPFSQTHFLSENEILGVQFRKRSSRSLTKNFRFISDIIFPIHSNDTYQNFFFFVICSVNVCFVVYRTCALIVKHYIFPITIIYGTNCSILKRKTCISDDYSCNLVMRKFVLRFCHE